MRIPRILAILSLFCVMATTALAQAAPAPGDGGGRGGRGGRGNWDPAAMRQRMLERMQEMLGATGDEWTVIKPRLEAVMEKQQATRELQAGRFGRRGDSAPPAAVADVEKAIADGDAAAIKAALDALRKQRAEKEAELTAAKNQLREVLSVAQEARLVLMGTLD